MINIESRFTRQLSRYFSSAVVSLTILYSGAAVAQNALTMENLLDRL